MTVSEMLADKYRTAAIEDAARQLQALTDAILALGDRLDGRLADVADAVTDVRTQVGELGDTAQASRRWWWRRSAAPSALAPADMALIRQALADAASWCHVDECSAAVENERLAFSYLALRERLGGGAS
jgi:hypothetical protein